MSLITHVLVLAVLIVDLIFVSTVIDRFWGHWATIALEFLLILGYAIFVLRLGGPWGDRGGGGR